MLDKAEARLAGTQFRGGLSPAFMELAAQKISENIQTSIDWAFVEKLHIYREIRKNNEASTLSFIQWISHSHPEVSLHRQSHKPIFVNDNFDVVLIPFLAIDKFGVRVGYGGGNYDKFLAQQLSAKIIAVGFDGQIIDAIKSEDHDIKPNIIITEKRIIHIDE